jgi:hypothetical protein
MFCYHGSFRIKSAINGGAEEFQSPDQKVGLYLLSKFDITFVQKCPLKYDWMRFEGFKVQNANSGQHLPRSFCTWIWVVGYVAWWWEWVVFGWVGSYGDVFYDK